MQTLLGLAVDFGINQDAQNFNIHKFIPYHGMRQIKKGEFQVLAVEILQIGVMKQFLWEIMIQFLR